MVRTQRVMMVPIILIMLLLSVALGAWLGMVPQYEWDIFLTRFQGGQVVSVAPATSAQSTIYVFDAKQPATRNVTVDLRSLEAIDGMMEMRLDEGLILRMELVQDTPNPDNELELFPPMLSARVAQP